MAADRLPSWRGDRLPTHHPMAPPIHRGDAFGFVNRPGRDYWWDQLGEKTRTQVLHRVGEVIEWWAHIYDEDNARPYAVVLGQRAFAICRPVTNERGRPANQLLVWSLRETSHRFAEVTGASPAPAAGHGADRHGGNPPATVDLPAHVRGFLGNLTEEAQQRLQQPFVAGDAVRESDFYYYGDEHQLDIWCYLAGSRTVTFASGTGLRRGRRREYEWRLVCRQADVVGNEPS